jgi:GH35 family endo-1,4-beta-xylanase
MKHPLLGTTYSHPRTSFLPGLSDDEVFKTLLAMQFGMIRLGCYWNEIQPKQDSYNFAMIKKQLSLCEKNGQSVVMIVGMKAHQSPEYYFPSWLPKKVPDAVEEYILPYIHHVVNELKQYSCIKYWQIENEPLDPSGPMKFVIPYDLLEKEVQYARDADSSRPIVLTLWGNELTKRKLVRNIAALADIVGIDLYYKVPMVFGFYSGPSDDDNKIKSLLQSINKPYWITELQAEPWERNTAEALGNDPRSINAELLVKNYNRVNELAPEAIFFWGFEYWYMKKLQGDSRMWDTIMQIVHS